jgi:very-long-chain enoyl-CoA reductase
VALGGCGGWKLTDAGAKYYPDRQSFKLGKERTSAALVKGTLGENGLTDGCRIYFKDLGPQIGWKTVFVAEYVGPMAVYALFFARLPLIYGSDLPAYTFVQT